MYVSHETPEETDRRLRGVLATADLTVLDGTFAFEEFPLHAFPARAHADALAIVRDDDRWSQLVSSSDPGAELFAVLRLHFSPGLDNSGFVGWLASWLKRRLGTGVFVICGQNGTRGGIFDYWGCPAHLRDAVLEEVHTLRAAGRTPSAA